LQVQVLPIPPQGKGGNMLGNELIRAYKENRLDGFVMVCKNRLCDRAIGMEFANIIINRAKEFDTYTFRCPRCSRILAIEFDYKEGDSHGIDSRKSFRKTYIGGVG
jgi:hypothetical protein